MLGKPVGSDLREGVVTLPAIYALADHPERLWIRELISSRRLRGEDLSRLRNLLEAGGYLERAKEVARQWGGRKPCRP
ncbi:MAG: hypothetical protein QME87_14520 [Bacillota bacterium]|nr:hypothetical protein [Bacillota bacterium]